MKEDCRQIIERVYLYLDGEVLTEVERADIQVHLEACAPCLERYGLETEVARLIHRLQGHDPCPQSLRAKVQNLFDA